MNCRKFEDHLAEWASGRLNTEVQDQMARHSAGCAVCAKREAAERELRVTWHQLPTIATPDIASRLSARLAVPVPAAPKSSLAARWNQLFGRDPYTSPRPVYRRTVFGAGLAATGLCGLLLWVHTRPMEPTILYPVPTPPGNESIVVPTAAHTDDQRVIQLVSEIRRLPDPDTDPFTEQPRERHRVQRLLLTGGDE